MKSVKLTMALCFAITACEAKQDEEQSESIEMTEEDNSVYLDESGYMSEFTFTESFEVPEGTETVVVDAKNFADKTRERVIELTEESVAYLVLANSDIESERYTDCVDDLTNAYQYAVAAEKLLPETTVIDRIEGVQSELISETVSSTDVSLVPVMASLENVDGLSDAKKEKVQANIFKAEQALDKNDRQTAMQYLEEVKDDLVITVVEIDVVALKELSEKSLEFAKEGNFGAAQQLIENSEFSVEVEIVAQKNRERRKEARLQNENSSSEENQSKLAH